MRCNYNYKLFQSINKEEENKSELIPKPDDLPDFKPNSKDLNSEHLDGENDPEETNYIDITINKIIPMKLLTVLLNTTKP